MLTPANGNIDRTLFLLHGSVLDTVQFPKSENDHQKEHISSMGLDTVCRMILDVVQWRSAGKAPIMPFCGIYNFRAARKNMQRRNKLIADDALSRDIESLVCAEEEYRRWMF
jgi:hypothetical protein